MKKLKLKVVVVSSATGVPFFFNDPTTTEIYTVVKTKGKVSKKQVSSTKKVKGISPCAQRLKVKVKPEKRGSVKKGVKVSLQSNATATGKIKLTLRGRDVSRLKLSKRLAKKILTSKVKLVKGKSLTKKLRISGRAKSQLMRQMKRKKVKRIKAKLILEAKSADGQRVRISVTVRLKRQ